MIIGVKAIEQGVKSGLLLLGEFGPWSKPGWAEFASRAGRASSGTCCRLGLDAESGEEVLVAELEELQEGRLSDRFFGL